MAKAGLALLALLIFGLQLFSGNNSFINDWDYRVSVTSPGTRDEARIGLIYYKNNQIKFNFDEILTPIGEYKFILAMRKWGSFGYITLSSQTSYNYVSSISIENEDKQKILQSGYYSGKEKIKNIDNFWIRVMRANEYYWVNPEKLSQFIIYKNWQERSAQIDYIVIPSERLRGQIDKFFGN